MNARSSFLLTISLSLISSGCASTMKEKITRNTLIASAIGAGVGSTREVYKSSHALMYGATLGLITALVSVYYYDPDKEIEEYKRKSKELAKSMDEFATESTGYPSKRPAYSGPALNNPQALPEKYRHLIIQGEWVLKQIDEWEQLDEHRKIHKTELLELIPPKFN